MCLNTVGVLPGLLREGRIRTHAQTHTYIHIGIDKDLHTYLSIYLSIKIDIDVDIDKVIDVHIDIDIDMYHTRKQSRYPRRLLVPCSLFHTVNEIVAGLHTGDPANIARTRTHARPRPQTHRKLGSPLPHLHRDWSDAIVLVRV